MTRRVERPEWPARGDLRVLNTDIQRVEAPAKVSGQARYAHDVRLPGMVWARMVPCPHPAARVTVDPAPALEVFGVVDARGLLPGEDPLQGETRYLGQPVAVVTAETPEAAEDGVRALVIHYEEKEWVLTREQALESFAPKVARGGNRRQNKVEGDRERAEAAIGAAAAAVDQVYELPVQHHVCLETHGLVADVRDGETTVYPSSQAVDFVASQVAGVLRVPESEVEAVDEHMGGGFGSKFQIGPEGEAACRISRDLGRPVHLMLTRRQEFLFGGNRSGSRQRLRAGAASDGRLVGLVAEIERFGGLGRGSHPGQPYIYSVEKDAYFREDVSVMANLDSNRAMRAPGHPQASFAIESVLDELAYELGLDPLEVRKRNLADEVYHRQLDRVAREIGWHDHPHKTDWDRSGSWTRQGIGFGVSTWGGGGAPGVGCEVHIAPDGAVEAKVGVQDIGTGCRTLVAAIVAETLGLSASAVTPRVGRSSYPPGVGSGGSVTTGSLAPPVLEAAQRARAALLEHLAGELGQPVDELLLAPGEVRDRSGRRLSSWSEACARLGPGGVRGTAEPRNRKTWGELSHLQASGVHGAQAARVEVDVLTGAVRVLKMVCVQDCGLPLNRLALRSQIQGAMIQALSYALFEERVLDADLGVMLSGSLDHYTIAGALEVPELVAIVDDEDERQAPIGIGEPPVIPGHAAIANAVYNACGVRVRSLPITPAKVLAGLAERTEAAAEGKR